MAALECLPLGASEASRRWQQGARTEGDICGPVVIRLHPFGLKHRETLGNLQQTFSTLQTLESYKAPKDPKELCEILQQTYWNPNKVPLNPKP